MKMLPRLLFIAVLNNVEKSTANMKVKKIMIYIAR